MLRPVPPRTQKTFPALLLCAAALLGAGACADDQSDAEADLSDEDTQALALEQNAAGVRFVSVTANGTGCPRGSWRGTVARDGSSVSLRFSSFSGEANRRRPLVVKDCTLGIKLESGESLSYALEDLRTTGRAYLRDGANVALSSKAYWQGNPAQSVDTSLTLSGRHNDSFTLGEAVPERARVWSPCGVQRDLNVVTRARLQSTGDSYGYFEVSRIGDVKIAIKRCGDQADGGAPDAETPDAETPDAETPDAETPDAETPDGGTPDAETPDAAIPPSGLTITGVTANGTGCAPGTTTTTISPDGQNFTVTPTAFNGTVAPGGASLVVKDCLLSIQVANPNNQRYGLEALHLRGTAKVGAGANLTISSNYYFQGAPVSEGAQETSIDGPYDQPLDITHNWPETAPLSSCSAERLLNASVRFRLRNGTPATDGSFNLGSLGEVAFRVRPCE